MKTRIVEVVEKDERIFYPQYRRLFFWFSFVKGDFVEYTQRFTSLEKARAFLVRVKQERSKPTKIIHK